MFIIREFQPPDAPQVEACIIELQDFSKRIDPHIADGRAIVGAYLSSLLNDFAETEGKIFVAEADRQVVGMVCLFGRIQCDELDEEKYEYAYVTDLVVLPAYRKQGIGKALMAHTEAYLGELGIQLVRISALARNRVARELYEALGFHEREIVMEKKLGSPKSAMATSEAAGAE